MRPRHNGRQRLLVAARAARADRWSGGRSLWQTSNICPRHRDLCRRFHRRRIFAECQVLIACRAAQGLGGALLSPASLAILQTTFSEHERSRAIGIWAGAGALMMSVGPLLGGWLVDQISWRAIFLINIPLAVIAIGLTLRFGGESFSPQAKRLDWGGAISVAIGLAALTWSLSAVPKSGFHDASVLGALGGVFFFSHCSS